MVPVVGLNGMDIYDVIQFAYVGRDILILCCNLIAMHLISHGNSVSSIVGKPSLVSKNKKRLLFCALQSFQFDT